MPRPPAIPVKLHKQVALIRTAEPIVTEELMARKSWRGRSWGGCQRRCCWSGRRRKKPSWTSLGGWGTHRGSSAEGQAIMDEGHDQRGWGPTRRRSQSRSRPEGYRDAPGRTSPAGCTSVAA